MSHLNLEWLTRHLGHSVNIHKIHYRQQSRAIELGKVAKVFIHMAKGTLADQKGKSFEEMEVCIF